MTAKVESSQERPDRPPAPSRDRNGPGEERTIKGIFLLIASVWTVLVAGLATLNYRHFTDHHP